MIAKQLREAIIKVLTKFNMKVTNNIVNMLVGTACVESDCGKFIKQVKGPACGIFQIEPNTAKDIINNYINYRKNLKDIHNKLYNIYLTLEENLCYNLAYSIFMCRVFYLRIKEPIPESVEDQAKYWKKYYNTYLGKGTEQLYINKVEKLDV